MKGMRVQSIIRELRGEKIDIIQYSDDAIEMATRALSPAKIGRVTILDPAERHLEVVVDDTQLSLAIGKKGQNVRLAAKLMGWRIDIKSEEEKRQEIETAMAAVGAGTPVSVLLEHGLGEKLVDKLLDAGSSTVERLADMTPEQLEEIPGIGPKMVEKITEAVSNYFAQFEEAQPAPLAEPVELTEEVEELAEDESAPSEEAAAAPMPGMPVEGEDQDESLDLEEDDEDFDNMDAGAIEEDEQLPVEDEEVSGQAVGETVEKSTRDENALPEDREDEELIVKE
jgi:N utilization substance protein A